MSNEKFLEILNERLAKGEITPSEYDELKVRLMAPITDNGKGIVAGHLESNEQLENETELLADRMADVHLPDGEFIIFIARSRLRFFIGVQVIMSLFIGLIAFPRNVVPEIREFLQETELYYQMYTQISAQLAPIFLSIQVIFISVILASLFIKIISQVMISNMSFFSYPVSRDSMNSLKELEKGAISSRMQDISKSYSGYVKVRVGGKGKFIYTVKTLPLIVMNGVFILIGTNLQL